MLAVLISAVTNAFETIFDKLILKKRGINFRHYLTISITIIFLINCILNFFFGGFKAEFFTFYYLANFSGMIVCAFLFNILFFWALSKEELCDVEPFVLLDRPVTVIFAATFFASERSIIPLVFSLIAAAALIISRTERRHFKIKKTTLALTAFVILIAIESLFVKVLVDVITPVSLYTFRTGILMILFWVILRPNVSKIRPKQLVQISGNAMLTVIQFIGRFYAIMLIGIVKTNIMLLLAPVLALFMSKIFLKENVTSKKAIADAVILICVIATLIIK